MTQEEMEFEKLYRSYEKNMLQIFPKISYRVIAEYFFYASRRLLREKEGK